MHFSSNYKKVIISEHVYYLRLPWCYRINIENLEFSSPNVINLFQKMRTKTVMTFSKHFCQQSKPFVLHFQPPGRLKSQASYRTAFLTDSLINGI